MKVAMIGTGYVGLVSGACFADFGHQVTCIDQNTDRVARLKAGKVPFFEPGLDELVRSNVRWQRLEFDTDPGPAVADADAVFVAVGTPSRRGDGFADLSHVEAAARDIARQMQGFTVVIIKSTVPVTTGDRIEEIIRAENPSGRFAVVSNPEFLREGSAISDFKRPDRVIVGTDNEPAREVMRELYRPLYLNETPILFTDRRTAELTKYAANAFLATKITFINQMADLCEKVGGSVQDIARGMGLDGRIGRKFLHAGPGYGGSCFPKDTTALVRTAASFEAPVTIVEAVVAANEARKQAMADRIIRACGGDLTGKTLSILGLTFKPNTDDMRDAPSLVIIPALVAGGAKVIAHDPEGHAEAQKLLAGIDYADDPYSGTEGADALVILTEWDQFRALDLRRIHASLKHPVIVDLRNIYRPDEMARLGFAYYSIGRPDVL